MTRPDLALLLLRLTGLGLFYAHGWGKLVRLTSGDTRFVEAVAGLGLPVPLLFAWAAVLAESLGGLLVALGLWTRTAAAFCAATLFVATFGRHHAHEHLLVALGLRGVPAETRQAWGNPELALVYLACFLAVLLLGPGRFSVEAAWQKRRGRRR